MTVERRTDVTNRYINRNLVPSISAVDLFCGAGGLTNGLQTEGINVVAGFDIEESCRFPYEHNNDSTFFNKDVSELESEFVRSLYPEGHIKLLAGCAPCQPFSSYSQGKDVANDRRWPLLYAFSRLIREVEPELVTMENVPDVTKHQVYDDFVNELNQLGYHVWGQKVYCPDYGLPQQRKRHVLVASRLGPIELSPPSHRPEEYVSVESVIGHLPPIEAGKKNDDDPLHRSANLSPLNQKRIRHSIPGGTWKDWPQSLVAKCHRKKSGKNYAGVYARMSPDKPAPTMTTQCYGYGNGRFGHYDINQNRAISIREAAIIQTFPDDYEFLSDPENISLIHLGKLIGNAVPVKLAQVIGKTLYEHTTDVLCQRSNDVA
ncbi:DNA cytosine methyltransferase [Idiomarina abyssalis]|uniref:DNA cytosine methyltransferase n=1 Tax=Idiomarina abyssalis TaxID=86102 RepID=UPI003A94E474